MHTSQDQEKNAEKKGFIVLIFAVLSALAIAAPLTMKLEEKGVIESAAAGMDLGEPPVSHRLSFRGTQQHRAVQMGREERLHELYAGLFADGGHL